VLQFGRVRRTFPFFFGGRSSWSSCSSSAMLGALELRYTLKRLVASADEAAGSSSRTLSIRSITQIFHQHDCQTLQPVFR